MSANHSSYIKPVRGIRHGFTLIELMLVMVIIAILAAVVIPKFVGRTKQANESKATQDVHNLKSALDMFEVDTGQYPASLNDLVQNPGNLQNWHGPYIEKLVQDPWNHDYIYHPSTGEGSSYQLLSSGADGQEGTADDIK